MKKISALVLVLILATAVMAGCSGDLFGCSSTAAITLATGENAKWFNQNHYEKITYDIVRYAYGEKNEDGSYDLKDKDIAHGKYTMTLEGMKSIDNIPEKFNASALGLSGSTKYNYSLLTIDYTLTYNEKSAGLNGKTDTMKSELLFYTSDLLPIRLLRSENYQSDSSTIDITTDYIGLKNTVKVNDKTIETEVKSGVYDNDLMFYVLRAKSSLVSGSSDSIVIFSPKDSAADEKAITKSMTFSSSSAFTNEDEKYLTVDKDGNFVPECYSSNAMPEKTEDGYKIPRLSTGLQINEKNRGAIIQLNYSLDDFVVLSQTMKSVLLSILTTEYDYNAPTATPAYSMVYTISDYSITP